MKKFLVPRPPLLPTLPAVEITSSSDPCEVDPIEDFQEDNESDKLKRKHEKVEGEKEQPELEGKKERKKRKLIAAGKGKRTMSSFFLRQQICSSHSLLSNWVIDRYFSKFKSLPIQFTTGKCDIFNVANMKFDPRGQGYLAFGT
jgi:hypothetical protein